jgi:hypothetical protein
MDSLCDATGGRRELNKLGHCRTSFIAEFVNDGRLATSVEGWDAADAEAVPIADPPKTWKRIAKSPN